MYRGIAICIHSEPGHLLVFQLADNLFRLPNKHIFSQCYSFYGLSRWCVCEVCMPVCVCVWDQMFARLIRRWNENWENIGYIFAYYPIEHIFFLILFSTLLSIKWFLLHCYPNTGTSCSFKVSLRICVFQIVLFNVKMPSSIQGKCSSESSTKYYRCYSILKASNNWHKDSNINANIFHNSIFVHKQALIKHYTCYSASMFYHDE